MLSGLVSATIDQVNSVYRPGRSSTMVLVMYNDPCIRSMNLLV